MRTFAIGAMIGSLVALGALTGCGGGSSSGTGGSSTVTTTSRDAPAVALQLEYTVTDLGATEYYYSNYGYISNRYRYNGVLRINDAGQIITNTNSQPVLYDGRPEALNGGMYGAVNGINNHSVVVGDSFVSDPSGNGAGSYRAAQWAGSAYTQVDAGAADTYSVAYAINDAGAVVGEATQGPQWYSATTVATRWQNGQQTTLGTLGGNYSLAYGVNASGMVIGWSQLTASTNGSYYDYNSPVHAFVWNAGTMTDLGVLAGGASSDAQGVNDSGQIVGSSETTPQGLYSYIALHAVTWTGGAISDLGTLGGPGSIAYALNNSAVIVGSSDTSVLAPQSTYYGWYYGLNGTGGTPGGVAGGTTGNTGGSGSNTAGSNAPPLTIGAGGRSVKATRAVTSGSSKTRGIGDIYVSHAFRYSAGKMEDLNSFIDPYAGWELLTATAINSKGQIVGFGKFGNQQHAYLLTPTAARAASSKSAIYKPSL